MFHTENIQLRKWKEADIPIYHSWRNDPEITQSTHPTLDVYRYEETKKFYDEVICASNSKCYMIEHIPDQKPIGVTSLIHIDLYNRQAECIIDIGEKAYWGRRYGQEALAILLRYGFNELGLHRISLKVFESNSRAIHLYKRIGFVEEGKLRQSLFRNGRWYDTLLMSLLAPEYKQLNS
ncbi:GNAT family N-acetyltransferase [Hazenella sp. IB182353]|uniref:GNAT family N-acetyltransferase n=1 Tax=Polycladospora coralii TaxID=2771432 RepID=UPI001747876C|nr:GNAT family protein [Polycladospora coralii]MBS7529642.1 GNAT family N-acetyltransferase [Polycladospora coralii]